MPHVLTALALLGVLAAPAPDAGPLTGGTEVRVDLPAIAFDSLATGTLSTGALDSEGRLWTWGRQVSGELLRVDAESPAAPAPADQDLADGIVQVAFGDDYALAVTAEGEVLSWGRNEHGRLAADPVTVPTSTTPLTVDLPGPATSVVAGTTTGYALLSDGTAWAWGRGSHGELGDGSMTDANPEPVKVALPGPATALVAGEGFAAALGADGSVHTWGRTDSGALGVSIEEPTVPVPHQVDLHGAPAEQIAAGARHVTVLTDTGLLAWGGNDYGQLGTGDTEPVITPVAMELPDATPAMLRAGGDNTAVLDTEGRLWTWGTNIVGTIGDGNTGVLQRTPTLASGTDGLALTDVSVHALTMYALDQEGGLWGWGLNDARQLGIDHPMTVPDPMPVDLGLTVTDVTFDGGSAVTLDQTGTSALATAPAHDAGSVDVVVSALDRNGDPVRPRVIADGFTYRADSVVPSAVPDTAAAQAAAAPAPTPSDTTPDVLVPSATTPEATPATTTDTPPIPPATPAPPGLVTTGVPVALALVSALGTLAAGALLFRGLSAVVTPGTTVGRDRPRQT
ncbi:hypothetical protein [Cellulomonas sp. NPDC089187]|uniref:RCC1 domain-containing protein n=1 Tax=Cellulomonas sp. NPDC089187 TaxID=3154970 RepID=UPI0034442F2D